MTSVDRRYIVKKQMKQFNNPHNLDYFLPEDKEILQTRLMPQYNTFLLILPIGFFRINLHVQ